MLLTLFARFSIPNLYAFLYFFVFISLAEEIIFRDYLYQNLEMEWKSKAIWISGLLWGLGHSILPIITTQPGPLDVLPLLASNIFGFMVVNYLCIFLLKKTRSIPLLVCIHAFLDYFNIL